MRYPFAKGKGPQTRAVLLLIISVQFNSKYTHCGTPLVQKARGSILGGVVNFHLKIFNLGARRGGDVHYLIARLYITVLD